MDEIDAVGHRVLHGGMALTECASSTTPVLAIWKECIPWVPSQSRQPHGHRGLPKGHAQDPRWRVRHRLPYDHACQGLYLCHPYEYYEKDKVRRYGFHGTSTAMSPPGPPTWAATHEDVKIISCHLGNGSSLAAIVDGKSVDTTMGLSPWPAFPWAPAAAISTPPSWST